MNAKKYIGYDEMPLALEIQTEFKGNSVTAKWDNDTYEVYSYNTLIFSDKNVVGHTPYFDNRSYSTTTSRLQNILIDVFGIDWSKPLRNKKRDDNVYPVYHGAYKSAGGNIDD